MSKNTKTKKKSGRDKEIEPDELVRRYAALKRFLEDNWGRIGQDLSRVREPEDVKSILGRIPNVQWLPAFRDFPTKCLLLDGSTKASWRQVRQTRVRHKDAKKVEGRLSIESHNASQAFQNVKVAYEAATADYGQQPDTKKAQRLKEIVKQLRVKELQSKATELANSFQEARENRESLEKLLASQEAWLARNEVVEFVRDRKKRYSKRPDKFAKAMAGLPFYDWLYSVRKCISNPKTTMVRTTNWFRVFELLESIVKKTRSANLKKLESKLKSKLLKRDTDSFLKSEIDPQWHYMTLAFADCRGKGFPPKDLPYKVMARFVDHYEGPSVAEAELAKHNKLLS